MEADPYGTQGASIGTRRTTVSRRPGEASRAARPRQPDVEVGHTRGVQFDTPAGTGAGSGGMQGGAMGLSRKKTLVRPERQRVDPTHRNYHYLQHTQQQNMPVQASTTGNRANVPIEDYDEDAELNYTTTYSPESPGAYSSGASPGASPSRADVMRGKSILGRDAPQRIPLKPEPLPPVGRLTKSKTVNKRKRAAVEEAAAREMTTWVFYCRTITCCFPGSLLRCFGIPGKMQQQAWREKIGLISVILLLGMFVGFLTFGFRQAVCSQASVSFTVSQITNGYLVIQGRAYDLTQSSHPAAIGVPAGSNILYPPVNAGGQDASFMFQNVNSACKGFITPTANSDILHDSNGNLGWYFPCNLFNPDGSTPVNQSEGPYPGYACHTTVVARQAYYNLRVEGEIVFGWSTDLKNTSRNLMVYSGYLSFLLSANWSGMFLIWIYWHGWIQLKLTTHLPSMISATEV